MLCMKHEVQVVRITTLTCERCWHEWTPRQAFVKMCRFCHVAFLSIHPLVSHTSASAERIARSEPSSDIKAGRGRLQESNDCGNPLFEFRIPADQLCVRKTILQVTRQFVRVVAEKNRAKALV